MSKVKYLNSNQRMVYILSLVIVFIVGLIELMLFGGMRVLFCGYIGLMLVSLVLYSIDKSQAIYNKIYCKQKQQGIIPVEIIAEPLLRPLRYLILDAILIVMGVLLIVYVLTIM